MNAPSDTPNTKTSELILAGRRYAVTPDNETFTVLFVDKDSIFQEPPTWYWKREPSWADGHASPGTWAFKLIGTAEVSAAALGLSRDYCYETFGGNFDPYMGGWKLPADKPSDTPQTFPDGNLFIHGHTYAVRVEGYGVHFKLISIAGVSPDAPRTINASRLPKDNGDPGDWAIDTSGLYLAAPWANEVRRIVGVFFGRDGAPYGGVMATHHESEQRRFWQGQMKYRCADITLLGRGLHVEIVPSNYTVHFYQAGTCFARKSGVLLFTLSRPPVEGNTPGPWRVCTFGPDSTNSYPLKLIGHASWWCRHHFGASCEPYLGDFAGLPPVTTPMPDPDTDVAILLAKREEELRQVGADASKARHERNVYQQEVRELYKKSTGLQAELDTAKKDIARLMDELTKYRGWVDVSKERDALKRQLADVSKDLDNTLRERDEAREGIRRLREDYTTMRGFRDKWRSDCVAAQEEAKLNAGAHAIVRKERDEAKDLLERAEKSKRDTLDNFHAARNEAKNFADGRNYWKSECLKAWEQLKVSSDLDARFAAVRDHASVLEDRSVTMTGQIADLNGKLFVAEGKVLTLQKDFDEAARLRDDWKRAHSLAAIERDALKREVEDLLWNLGGCSTFAGGFDPDAAIDTQRARAGLRDVIKMARTLKATQAELKVTKDSLDSYHKQSVDLAKTLKSTQAELERTKDAYKVLMYAKGATTPLCATQEYPPGSKVGQFMQESTGSLLEGLRARVADLEAELAKQTQRAANLETDYTLVAKDNGRLQAKLEKKAERLNKLTGRMAGLFGWAKSIPHGYHTLSTDEILDRLSGDLTGSWDKPVRTSPQKSD